MDHFFKSASITKLVQYNKLLLASLLLSLASLVILALLLTNKEERWLLIPAIDVDRKMNITNRFYHSNYLKEWARFVAKEIFTTSPDEFDRQIASIRRISSNNKDLESFFKKQSQFVKGSRVSSVFYFKEAGQVPSGIIIYGTIHYWFGNSNINIAQEKRYLVSYKVTSNGLLLLTNVKEIHKKTGEEKNAEK